MNSTTSKVATLLGTASLLTMASAMAAHAQQVRAGADGAGRSRRIAGAGVDHGLADSRRGRSRRAGHQFEPAGLQPDRRPHNRRFVQDGAAANVSPGPVAVQSGANIERATRVNIRQLDTGNATRSLLMVDGVRVPGQGNGTCEIDPSIIPALSQDRH
jgi:hypothetical protein